jgi:cytochrome c-type biogenesis protein CcmH
VDGPNTPLAARKLTVNELPTTLTLSDQDAMIDGLVLSQFGELEFTARVSSSGEVAPEPGDLEGRVRVGPTTQATLVIDTRLE